MLKKLVTLVTFTLITMASLVFPANAAQLTTNITSLTIAGIDNRTNSDATWAESTTVVGSINQIGTRKVYMRIDLSGIKGHIVKATLKMKYQMPANASVDRTDANVSIFPLENDTWNTGTITYNNAPAHGEAALLSQTFTYKGTEYRNTWEDAQWDITDYIIQEYNSDKKAGMVIYRTNSLIRGEGVDESGWQMRTMAGSADTRPYLEVITEDRYNTPVVFKDGADTDITSTGLKPGTIRMSTHVINGTTGTKYIAIIGVLYDNEGRLYDVTMENGTGRLSSGEGRTFSCGFTSSNTVPNVNLTDWKIKVFLWEKDSNQNLIMVPFSSKPVIFTINGVVDSEN